jgi:hypothetical protein
VDLNKLSASALRAAMTTGTDGWGQWGSVVSHTLYVQPIKGRRRRMCRCGCRKRSTHGAFANGVILTSGCELTARRFVKQLAPLTTKGLD